MTCPTRTPSSASRPDADDEAVRRRYLELTREFPPEQRPEKFAAIRAAFEKVRTADARARYRLFDAGADDTIDALIEDATCRTPRRRPSLSAVDFGHHPASLTPDRIDAVLADFRRWLEDVQPAPPPASPEPTGREPRVRGRAVRGPAARNEPANEGDPGGRRADGRGAETRLRPAAGAGHGRRGEAAGERRSSTSPTH